MFLHAEKKRGILFTSMDVYSSFTIKVRTLVPTTDFRLS